MPKLKRFKFGSHRPVVRAICEVFSPESVLELGAGRFSTKYFHDKDMKCISVENDEEWFEKLSGSIDFIGGNELILHKIEGITKGTRCKNISELIKTEYVNYYIDIINNNKIDFLFIDNFRGLRNIALVNLYKYFDFVVFHDAEDHHYEYDIQAINKDDYIIMMYKSLGIYSGVLINRKYQSQQDKFLRKLKETEVKYCNVHKQSVIFNMEIL
ncbi:MAG: hypothetical protein ACTSSP_01380 [Candidatus Asgardarchaeia archaeon]